MHKGTRSRQDRASASSLLRRLRKEVPRRREEVRRLIAEHGSHVVAQITVAQLYGGLRGVRAMVCDTSGVDPQTGFILAGRPIAELTDRLPEELFCALCTGELPNAKELRALQDDLRVRAEVPDYVWRVLRGLPGDIHPMRMFSIGVVALGHESQFRRRYEEGLPKEEYWQPVVEDALCLMARFTTLAAGIQRIRFGQGDPIAPDASLDWAGNYVHMLGIPDPDGRFRELMRLYLAVQCDHGAGDVSSNSCHVVASALADPYYAIAAALNGQAGPLHGLASQEVMHFLRAIREKFGGVPSSDELRAHVWELLRSGRVIPGYGHAVLRVTDPRFTALHAFGCEHCADDPLFRIADLAYQVVPAVLREHGKAKNPYPNADAISGVLLHHYGIREPGMYTVNVAITRSLGLLAQLIWNRALGAPIVRPMSISTDEIKTAARG